MLVVFGSCELDLAPENTMVDETVYRNANTAEAALLGAYVRLNCAIAGAPNDQNYYANIGYMYLYGDVGTDNLKAQSTSTDVLAMETSQYTDTQHEGFLLDVWRNGYNAIDYANNIIRGVTEYGAYDETLMRQHIAEARFIRGYVYFQLLQLFGDQALMGNDEGLGLVMRLDPYDGYDPDIIITRSTNAQTWEQIITDLTECVNDLPESPSGTVTERVRATQPVVWALLSRVYLYKGTYTNNQEELALARDYAQQVINSNAYTFSNDRSEYLTNLFPYNVYSEGFTQPTNRSSEIIFFQSSRLVEEEYQSGIYQYYSKNSFYVPDAMRSYYESGDIRGYNDTGSEKGDYLLAQGSSTSNPTLITSMKYTSDNTQDYGNDVIYMRLAEVKLTYAEALARCNNAVTQEAVDQLNDIHQRAFADGSKPELYTTGDFASVNDFLEAVLRERNRELAYEGLHRWDIIRTNNALGDETMGAVPSNQWNAPVPNYEITISEGAIQQNSGY